VSPSGRKQPVSEQVAQYDALIASIPELERKGAVNPYTAVNGNMFTLLSQSQTLAIRLPEKAREEFLAKYQTTLFEAYGAVMREYVLVPDWMLSEGTELREYVRASYDYAKTLRPKPSKKKA
jgi:TfoX/Sxy family transcriptional regulator of competence genes